MAFTDSGPEIVLLGRKSRKESETRNISSNYFNKIKPDCVPREVLHSLFITLEDDRQIKINTELVVTEDIEYKNLTKYLEKTGHHWRTSHSIEVVVDLEKATGTC